MDCIYIPAAATPTGDQTPTLMVTRPGVAHFSLAATVATETDGHLKQQTSTPLPGMRRKLWLGTASSETTKNTTSRALTTQHKHRRDHGGTR